MDPEKASFIRKVEGIDGVSAAQKARGKQLADFFLCSRDNNANDAFEFFNIFNQYVDEPYLDQINPSFDDEDLARIIDRMIIFPLETEIDGLPALYIDFSQINLSALDITTVCQAFILNLLAMASKYNLHKKDQNRYLIVIDCLQAGYSNWYKELFQYLYFLSIDCFPAMLDTIYFVGASFPTKMFLYYTNHTSDFKEDLNELCVFLADENGIVERATEPNKLIYELGGNAQQNQWWVSDLKSRTRTILFGNIASRSNLTISQTRPVSNEPQKSVTFGQEILATEAPAAPMSQHDFKQDFRSSFQSAENAQPKKDTQADPSGEYEVLGHQQYQPSQAQGESQQDLEREYEVLDNQGLEIKPNRKRSRRSTMNLVSNLSQDRYDCFTGLVRLDWLQALVSNPGKLRSEFDDLEREFPYNPSLCTVSERWKPGHHRAQAMPAIQDETRVVVQRDASDVDGYINANFVDGYLHPKKFIIAESPQDKTLEKFLLMIWQQQVECVMDLVGVKPGKCVQYFPNELIGTLNVGFFTLTFEDLKFVKQTLSITTVRMRKEDEGTERKLSILTLADINNFATNARALGNILLDQLNNQLKSMKTDHPLLMHDSSGNRLPGVMAAMNICKTMAEVKKQDARFDLKKLVCELRSQRFGLVYTYDDYLVLYRSIVGSVCRKIPNLSTDIKENLRRQKFI